MTAPVTAEEIARLRALVHVDTPQAAVEMAAAVPRLLDALVAERSAPEGCGDHGCEAATVKGGMRTNGGCRCDERALRRALRAERKRTADLLDRCAALEATVLGIPDVEREAREAGIVEGRASAVRALRRMADTFDATTIPERAKVAAVLRGMADGLEEPPE